MPDASSTHPFISFRLNVRPHAADWLNLGEARSKCEHLAGVPVQPDVAAELARVTLIKGAVATTAIEGNTLTEAEVRQLLDGVTRVERSREYQLVEIKNVLNAIDAIDGALHRKEPIPLSVERLLELNRTILEGTEHETSAVPGRFRQHSVVVGTYKGPEWDEVPRLCEDLFRWLNGTFDDQAGGVASNKDDERIPIALIKAAVTHVYLAWIHPFGDGNGRTARLIEVQILSQAGVPLVATNLLSDHYNQTRDRYYRELRLASENGGDLTSFVSYAIEGFVDGLRDQVARVRRHQLEIAWRTHVHEKVDGGSAAQKRRRCLLLDMPLGASVHRNNLDTVSTRVAREYAKTGDRTLPRDINALTKAGLLKRRGNQYRVAFERVAAFVPTFDSNSV